MSDVYRGMRGCAVRRSSSVRSRRLSVLIAAVAIVTGSLFAGTPAGAATTTAASQVQPTVAVRVARPFNFRVPDTIPNACSTSDSTIVHCFVEHFSSWRLQVLCIQEGSAVVTVTGKGPDFVQPLTCTPLPPNTTNFRGNAPAVASKGPTCTSQNPSIVCIVRYPQSAGQIAFLCRTATTGTIAVHLVDTTFVLPHTCAYEASFQLPVGGSRASAIPRRELGTAADRCQSSNEAIAVCWTHGRAQGFAMHCVAPGDVILVLKNVLGGDLDVPLSCRAM
jgi:hypothetical protein